MSFFRENGIISLTRNEAKAESESAEGKKRDTRMKFGANERTDYFIPIKSERGRIFARYVLMRCFKRGDFVNSTGLLSNGITI